jgi:hypothetical protein
MLRSAAAIAVVVLAGCQAMMYGTAEDFRKLSLGMSKTEVMRTIGEPASASADERTGEEVLVYRRMPQTVGWVPLNYEVVLKDGRVVRYGQRH